VRASATPGSPHTPQQFFLLYSRKKSSLHFSDHLTGTENSQLVTCYKGSLRSPENYHEIFAQSARVKSRTNAIVSLCFAMARRRFPNRDGEARLEHWRKISRTRDMTGSNFVEAWNSRAGKAAKATKWRGSKQWR
jgi:hypothetical protein